MLTHYALKKEKLLIYINKDMNTEYIKTMIVVGLTKFIIDKAEVQETTGLFNKLRFINEDVKMLVKV